MNSNVEQDQPIDTGLASDTMSAVRGPAAQGRRACVVGAGIGGLALAIRLQSAGIQTTVVEARDKPGGCAYVYQKDGFTFDAGPTTITDPAALAALWTLTDHRMADDVELLPVTPAYRLNWPDGNALDLSNDEDRLISEIARINPADIAGYQRFLDHSAAAARDGYAKVAGQAFPDKRSLAKITPFLTRYQAWRSAYALVSRYVDNERLREALSFRTIMAGGNPMTASGLHALFQQQDGGVWCAKGGTGAMVAAMVRHFERLGGTLRLHDPVTHIHTLGSRATEVETQSGWRERFDAVASNADIIHTYRDLLHGTKRGGDQARALAKKSFSPGVFVVHFGVEGTWPGIPHNTVLFGPRYTDFLTDVYEYGVLPADFLIHLHHASVTDPDVAPEGKSTFQAVIPVANMGKLPVDWEQMGPVMEDRVLDEIERRLIPDLRSRIVTSFHHTPRDYALELNAHLGSAFSIEPLISQSTVFRGHNRDDVIDNFYLVGAGTHPGAGISGVVASAAITAGLMIEDLAG